MTRHNVGFRIVDEFAKKHSFSDFYFSKKTSAEISKGAVSDQEIILAKPQTFMNLSGKAVKLLINFYKITPPGLVVIHDDMDIPFGKIRISKGRGAAGHKGVESIIKELGTKNFVRFRVGIQPKTGKPKNIEKPSTRAKLGAGPVPHRNEVSGAGFVLQKFNKDEEKIVKEVIKKTAIAVDFFLKEGLEKAMTKYNK